ncbi:MAG: MAPEG family protein [Oceanococcus sp.]
MSVTALYAGLLGLWFLVLSIRVIQGRRKGIHIGDGGDAGMLRLIRGHANFAEYTPLCLLLIGMAEMQGLNTMMVHGLGGGLLLGRLLHGYAFCFTDNFPPGRMFGTILTFVTLLVASLALLWLSCAA